MKKKDSKQFFTTVVILLFTLSTVAYGNAAIPEDFSVNRVTVKASQQKVIEPGNNIDLEGGRQTPGSILSDGTLYLPLRKLAELLHKEIKWDDQSNTVIIEDLEKTFKASDGTPIHYSDQGAGCAILFIHGWGSDLTAFNEYYEKLSEQYRCIALDLRGHGNL